MMNEKPIFPGTIQGTMAVMPSKSITHRLFIMSALSQHPRIISQPLFSEDTCITLNALKALGYPCQRSEAKVYFQSAPASLAKTARIFVENSGTSARLLTALAAIHPGNITLDGSERMRERPMDTLIKALQQLNIPVIHQNGYLPLTISGGALTGGTVQIDASKSSQFISALLLVAPLSQQGIKIVHGGRIASAPYVDMTVALMQNAGIQLVSQPTDFWIPGQQTYQLEDSTVEGDYSNASYFLAAAALTAGEIYISNLKFPSVQGDQAILDILEAAGARVKRQTTGIHLKGPEKIKGIVYDMQPFPDIVPTAAILALFADRPSRLCNVAHLRYKECDRLGAIINNSRLLGGDIKMESNDLIITPGPLKGAALPTYNDHRIAMSFSLVGLRIPGVIIQTPECVQKSYPDYWRHFEALLTPHSKTES